MFRRRRRKIIPAVLIGAIAIIGFGRTRASPPPSSVTEESSAVLRLESGDFIYTYHLPTGTEGLFDKTRDPRMLVNLAVEKPEVARSLRRQFLRQLRVRSLEELRAPHADTTERLRGLGYL